MSYINNTLDLQKFGGTIYYIDDGYGSDSNSGRTPDAAFKTIGYGITTMSSGDALNIHAGTYTEIGLDLSKANSTVWIEHGTVIQPGSGTALTISGNMCQISCPNGSLKIIPAAATTGVLVTGTFCYVNDVRVAANSSGAIGFDIGDAAANTHGDGTVLNNCRSSNPTTAAFKIQADKVLADKCLTGGNGSDNSIGYWVTSSSDKTRLENCNSQGHKTSGFQIDTGCTNCEVNDCSSGGGDGKWTDADATAVWSNFKYDDHVYKSITLTATGGVGGAGTNYNLFKVTGGVKVSSIYGEVTTLTPATASTINLELYSTNAAIDISDAAGAPDLASRVVGTIISRQSVASDPLVIVEADSTPAVTENANYRDPKVPIILVKDDAADTYIQLVLTAAMATGAIRFQVVWEPISSDGFVETA